MIKTAVKALAVLTAIAVIAQLSLWYPHLPEIVPSHFNAQGEVDGEMARPAFVGMMAGLQVMLLGGLVFLAWAIKFIPTSLINIPNKEYWLAPERREETLSETATWLCLIGSVSSWLIMALFHLTCLVAIQQRDSIDPEVWIIVGVYMLAIFGFCAYTFRRYRIPSQPTMSVGHAERDM